MPRKDWDKGLPIDILAIVARGRNELKVMRQVSKSWQAGYEASTRKIKLSGSSPIIPQAGISKRFPVVRDLALGACRMDEACLARLAGLAKLESLSLGVSYTIGPPGPEATLPLVSRLAGPGLAFLQGLQIQHLDLSQCHELLDAGLAHVRTLPLTSLELTACFQVNMVVL